MSVDVTKLPSGLTVITDTMPHLETAALGVWAGVGGRDEKPNEHGISHLLEHMAFKGTTRRSSREIVEEIEAVGGDLNAGTSTETTAYYARVLKADVPLALDVLSDILANPSFVPDELEREKNVIVQEIGAAQDTLVSGFVVAVRCLRVGFGGMTALIRCLASTSLRLLAS
jgi:predicted Zn-dependent peptidase